MKPDHTFGFEEFVSRMTFVPPPPSVFNVKTDLFYVKFPSDLNYVDGGVSPGETLIRLFDGSVLTKFISKASVQKSLYPTIYWKPRDINGNNIEKLSNSYTITTANDSKGNRGRDPRAFAIDGTKDDPESATAVWVQLDIRQDQDWTTNYQLKTFDFPNTQYYKGYRLRILQTGTGSTLDDLFQISEWTMNYREQL
ncbi:hypothetical protein [Mucilaginibacter antarcticus]|uniref:hypothetical protein n=1 Tax=Mucilaginibacter antarcticus TaxID=1855725 RepID=UPI00362FDF5C